MAQGIGLDAWWDEPDYKAAFGTRLGPSCVYPVGTPSHLPHARRRW